MTNYYVRKSGNDSNDGLAPSSAWLTISKALGAAGIASGDTVYIGAGVYREKVTCNLTSPTVETFIIGDVDGSQTGDMGEIRLTNYLTDDVHEPTDQNLVDFNAVDHLTFRQIMFQFANNASETSDAIVAGAISQYISFVECSFNFCVASDVGSNNLFNITGAIDTPLHWLFDRCLFFSAGFGNSLFLVNCNQIHTGSFDADFVIRNCSIIAGAPVVVWEGNNGVAAAPAAGGLIVLNCFVLGATAAELFKLHYVSGTGAAGCYLYNNICIPPEEYFVINAFQPGAGSVAEDYNYVIAVPSIVWNNVTSGGHSIIDMSYAPLIHFGQEWQRGLMLRPLGMPTADSPLLGFGDNGAAPSIDILNRPRPAGGQSVLKAVGAYERHDTGAKEIIVVDSSPASVKIIGPGDHDFYIPVDATATIISIKARYDTNHGAGNKPQVILLTAPEIGVPTETKTMAVTANNWEMLTFGAITPTAKGVVIIRCISRSAAGNGIAYFDTVNVA